MSGNGTSARHRRGRLTPGRPFAAVATLLAIVFLLAGARGIPAHVLHEGPGAGQPFDRSEALAHSRTAIGNQLGQLVFRDRAGGEVRLDALRGRPLVVSLIFTSCYGTCGVLTRRLSRTVGIAREALGEDSFTVVTLGFDASADTPSRMAEFARQQGIGDKRWLVLSGDEQSIARLARNLGFSFAPSPRGFDHVSQTTIVDSHGQVYRQVYGDNFPTTALVEPLKTLVLGGAASGSAITDWFAGVKLLCTVYDPAADRYRIDYSIIVAAFSGALSLGAIALFILKSWNAGRHPEER